MNRWIIDIGQMGGCLLFITRLWQDMRGDHWRLDIGAYLRALFSGKVFHPFSHNEYVPPFLRRSYRILVIPSTIILLIIWAMSIVQLVRRMLGPIPAEDPYARFLTIVVLGYLLYTCLEMIAFDIIARVITRKGENEIIRRAEKYHDEKHGKP